MEDGADPQSRDHWAWAKKATVFLLVCVTILISYAQFGDTLTLANLAERESDLRSFQQAHPWLVYGVAFLVYVAVTGLSLPGAAVLTLVFGWYFGFWQGIILVSFASTTGATLAFLLSRYLFRDSIQQRFGERLGSFNQALEQEGPFFLFTLRLIPAVPFFVINAVMGLTPILTSTFWWVSQLGMFPGTVVYVYAGSRVPNLRQLADQGIQAVFSPSQLAQIVLAFVLLGVFPLLVRFTIKVLTRSKAASLPGKPAGSFAKPEDSSQDDEAIRRPAMREHHDGK